MKTILEILSILVIINTLNWFSSNNHVIVKNLTISLTICVVFGIISSLMFYGLTKTYYGKLTLWEIRMITFSSTYLVFPFLTWRFLGESPLEPKTLVSIAISIVLVLVQFFWK